MAAWMGRALSWYDRMCRERPIVTKSVTSVGLFSLGDVIAQAMRPVSEEEALLDEERRQKLRAAARNGSAGDGPVDSLPWHDALPAALTPRPWRLPIVDRHFRWELRSWDEHDFARTGRQATWGAFLGVWAHSWFKILDRWFGSSPTTRIALLKNVSDMVLYQPVTICAFTSLTGVMMGKTGGELVERLKTVFPVVYTAVWVVWPPWNLFQFLVVPVHLRVVALNLLLIPWGCFMSHMLNQPDQPAAMEANTEA